MLHFITRAAKSVRTEEAPRTIAISQAGNRWGPIGQTTLNPPLTMDTSAREAMKDAAKCDKHCDLQISANQQISERIMRRWGLLYLQA